MRALIDWEFDAARPLQTKRGTKQALRCGDDKVEELIDRGLLEVVYIDKLLRITTNSILKVAASGTKREVA
jgi:hypothetical protein